MAKSIGFHSLFQNGQAKQALERYGEIYDDDDSEIERLFDALADGGTVYMPLGDYGFGRRFGWVEDCHADPDQPAELVHHLGAEGI
ncbi:hypothetical protein [Candidatus Poriferisodalis sp.]|uniref:hypothetical protein n=1 Tax=Candidatus Poriferisodalis sp. TaxID=3101277 RepID=UPI003B026481